MNRGLILRIGAALAILISGIVHLDLYFNQDYRFASSDVNFGRSILLNAISSGIIAVALVARKDWFVKAAGIGFALSTIILFAYTHAENSFLGYAHGGPVFEPSPHAQIALIVQIAAIVLLAFSFLPGVESEDSPPVPLPAVGAAFAIAAIALIGLTLKWKPDDTKTVSPATTAATTTTSAAASATTAAGAYPSDTTAGDTTAGDSTATTAGGAAATGGQAVAIAGFKFDAPALTVAVGTTVTWTNTDKAEHSVVAEDTSFISDNLAQGATFEHTFDTPGTFPYICGIHSRMKGTITVTG
jgi:plastocyanin